MDVQVFADADHAVRRLIIPVGGHNGEVACCCRSFAA
jgi:hypothetical protein